MRKITDRWATEADMFAAFRVEAEAAGFRCVPEAGGHDMLLIASRRWEPDPEPDPGPVPGRRWKLPPALVCDFVNVGDVVAVEGKLHATPTLLRQALPPHRRRHWRDETPTASADFYVVLVPGFDPDFGDVAQALDVGVCVLKPPHETTNRWENLPARIDRFTLAEHHRVLGHPRVAVTSLDVDMPAGAPAPRALTPWKLAAVRLCLAAAGREITEADFVGTPVRRRTFIDRGWLRLVRRDGRHGVYVLDDGPGRPDREYPEIVEAIQRAAAT